MRSRSSAGTPGRRRRRRGRARRRVSRVKTWTGEPGACSAALCRRMFRTSVSSSASATTWSAAGGPRRPAAPGRGGPSAAAGGSRRDRPPARRVLRTGVDEPLEPGGLLGEHLGQVLAVLAGQPVLVADQVGGGGDAGDRALDLVQLLDPLPRPGAEREQLLLELERRRRGRRGPPATGARAPWPSPGRRSRVRASDRQRPTTPARPVRLRPCREPETDHRTTGGGERLARRRRAARTAATR